jgi:hypothetical protein
MSVMTPIQRAAVAVLSFVAFVSVSAGAEQAKPADAANAVSVTVKYDGKGMVDASHKIWVWLFDTPDIGPGAIPIAEESMAKNGGTVNFPGVAATVYIAVAYDEQGGFAGQAPPPPGSPIALYGMKDATDKPLPVIPGPKGAVKMVFDDTQRMQ